jgi:undecaprenyl-diphosphatase
MLKYLGFIKKQVLETFRDVSALGSFLFLCVLALFFLFIDYNVSLKIIVGLVIIEFVGALIKVVFHRTRPNNQRFSNIFEKIDSGSFPSIHAARVMLVALVVFHFFSSPIALLLLALLVILVGVSRIVLDKHYFSDVFAGFVFGLLVWYLVRVLF